MINDRILETDWPSYGWRRLSLSPLGWLWLGAVLGQWLTAWAMVHGR